MSIIQAALLGLVQGLCEFLPISSTGHLVLLQKVLTIDTENMAFFIVMLHLATLVSVVVVLRKEILSILKKPVQKLTGMVILATIPTGIIGLIVIVFFKDFYNSLFSGQFLAIACLLTSILLTLSERVSQGRKRIGEMKPSHALIVGTMQGVALMPGLSRSGTTIAGGIFCGLDREFAAKFSFLLSIPAILASAVMEGKDALEQGVHGISWAAMLVGMAVAGVSGYIAVKFMIKLLIKGKLYGFAVYMFIMGVLIMLDQAVFHLVF